MLYKYIIASSCGTSSIHIVISICNVIRSRKRLPMLEKWILSFPQNWVVGTCINMIQKNTRHKCLTEPQKRAYKVRILKNVLLRKLCLFGVSEDEKNWYLSTAYTNLAEISPWDVWSVHALILQSSSKSVEQSANFKECTFEKITFEVFRGYKDKKFILQHCLHQLAEISLWDVWNIHVLILQSSSKSVEHSVIFRSSIWWPQRFKNLLWLFLTQFNPISEFTIAFFYKRPLKLMTKIPQK